MIVVVVGSRGSDLACAQVQEVLTALKTLRPDVRFRHQIIVEAGDSDTSSSLSAVSQANGGAAFANAQEEALLRGRVDLVVHSLKDLPTTATRGLTLLPPPTRAEVRDALCGSTLAALPAGARVGTSAQRRIAQLLRARPDVQPVPIRGNVPPRLAKMESQNLDAVLLAAAGLQRLDLQDRIGELLSLDTFLPAPGQGALGIQIRSEDTTTRDVLDGYGDAKTFAEVRAERGMLHELHGGCAVPIGAYAIHRDGSLLLRGQVTSLDGRIQVAGQVVGTPEEPEKLGHQLARQLLDAGAEDILAAIR
ncbi:hydroxymethylbilane synthase [Streptacidiphilus sp. EB103A]|uniref:hydroxymethylbilane synthase n=1 Tax=Streptacidiphilus sp. EB103A TaxID=3156275 RepID=UPI003519B773